MFHHKKVERFIFSDSQNFRCDQELSSFTELAQIVEVENLRLKSLDQTGTTTIHKIDENDHLLVSVIVTFPFKSYVEEVLQEFLVTKTTPPKIQLPQIKFRLLFKLLKLPKLPELPKLPKLPRFPKFSRLKLTILNFKSNFFIKFSKNKIIFVEIKARLAKLKQRIKQQIYQRIHYQSHKTTPFKIKLLPAPKIKIKKGVFIDSQGIVYNYQSNLKGAFVSGFKGIAQEIVIQDVIKIFEQEFPVIAISQGALANFKFTKITFPSNLKIIGARAIQNNKLTKLELPKNVEEIGNYAFYNNNLTTIKLPFKTTEIADFAFANNNLVNLDLSKNLRIIGKNAFSNNKLEKIIWNNPTLMINAYAFCANNLQEVKLTPEIKLMTDNCFDGNVFIQQENNNVTLAHNQVTQKE